MELGSGFRNNLIVFDSEEKRASKKCPNYLYACQARERERERVIRGVWLQHAVNHPSTTLTKINFAAIIIRQKAAERQQGARDFS